jgi:hypothetical protein
VPFDKGKILTAIKKAFDMSEIVPSSHFGAGKSIEQFLTVISSDSIWSLSTQKQFCDIAPVLRT